MAEIQREATSAASLTRYLGFVDRKRGEFLP